MFSANWYLVDNFLITLAVSSSKPYCSNGVVDVEISAPGTSVVLVKEENSSADAVSIPPDQEALGMMLLLTKVLKVAKESIRPVGSLVPIVARVAPE